jgi:hypothetical protein
MSWHSCSEMFYNCNNLVKVQDKFYSSKLDEYCYSYMFSGCTSLTKTPQLPSLELANYCYLYMFQNCTSLA